MIYCAVAADINRKKWAITKQNYAKQNKLITKNNTKASRLMAQLKTWHTYWCLWWQTSNHRHCNRHAQKSISGDFQVRLSSFSWSKTTLCILRNKHGFQIGNAMEKNKLWFDQEKMLKMAWYSTQKGFWPCQFQWHRLWGCTFRCFWDMGYMYALSWKGLLLEYFATLLKRLHLKKTATKCSLISSPIILFS